MKCDYLYNIPEQCQLLTDSQEIDHVWEAIGIPGDDTPTGLAVETRDGDYLAVWATWSRAPYFLGATYYRIR